MAKRGQWPRWLRFGCLGALALAGFVVVWAVALFVTAFSRGQNEVVETRRLSSETGTVRPADVDTGATPPTGRVVLDFTVGEFRIAPGEPGEPLRVEAEFDTRSYELTETMETSEGGTWTYHVSFGETSWFKDGGLRALLGGSFPEIEVFIPPDAPLVLEGKFGKGAASLQLGGLWLTEVDLEFEKGAMDLDFDAPLAEPVRRISLRSKQCGLFAGSLGNASPSSLVIDHRMGGMFVDLEGAWARDGEILITQSMGGGEVRLPDDVEIAGLTLPRLRAPRPHAPEIPLPKLTMSVSSRFGSLSVNGADAGRPD